MLTIMVISLLIPLVHPLVNVMPHTVDRRLHRFNAYYILGHRLDVAGCCGL
jgi:hypothetical protein